MEIRKDAGGNIGAGAPKGFARRPADFSTGVSRTAPALADSIEAEADLLEAEAAGKRERGATASPVQSIEHYQRFTGGAGHAKGRSP
jgi:hypothetical protein